MQVAADAATAKLYTTVSSVLFEADACAARLFLAQCSHSSKAVYFAILGYTMHIKDALANFGTCTSVTWPFALK